MAQTALTTADSSKRIEWMWKSNPNPWSKSEPATWSRYSDVENLIIEEAFSKNLSEVTLDDYSIDFQHKVQISLNDDNKQRPVQRMVCNREDHHLREERFFPDPISPRRPCGGEYGWVSPFVIEARRYLGLRRNQLPSKDEDIVPMIVEKAASGIIEEGKQIRKQREAEKLANLLREKKDKGIKEVWKRCAYLYSMESFLYKKLNETMRLIGSCEHEQIWRSKVPTLGPFCLLLWDDPFNNSLKTDMTLYRGAKLTDEQIAVYKGMVEDHPLDLIESFRSFQAFTSSSRNRDIAENFPGANVLFIMEVLFAFTVDLASTSEYTHEEEELITPGVNFRVKRVEFDSHKKKHVIYLQLRQRFSGRQKNELEPRSTSNTATDEYDLNADARIARAIRFYRAAYPDTTRHVDLDGLTTAGALIRRYRLRAAQGGEDVVRDDLDYAGEGAAADSCAVFLRAFGRDGDYVDND